VATGGASATPAVPTVTPATATIAANATLPFSFTYTASATGTLRFRATASGTAANTGAALSFGPVTTNAATVEAAAGLSASIEATPATGWTSTAPVDLVLTVTNTAPGGGAPARVTDVTQANQPADGASCTSVTPAASPGAPVEIPAGDSATFAWSCTPTGPGTLDLGATVDGVDGNSLAALPQASASTGGVSVSSLLAGAMGALRVAMPAEVVEVARDPFADGSPALFVSGWQGGAWTGPSHDGRSLAHLDSIGGGVASVARLAVGVDAGPTPASNPAWASQPAADGVGAPGCVPGSSGCGPDDETGAAVLATGTMAGHDLLAVAGSRPGGTRYLYVSGSASSPVDLAWVDLGAALAATGSGGSAPAATALGFVPGSPDRLYAGYASAGGMPLLLALEAPPLAGLEAVPGADVIDLGIGEVPGVAGGQGITSIHDLAGVLYVGHVAGVVRAAARTPAAATVRPGDWAAATPSAAAWSAKVPVSLPGAGPVLPSDRAVASLATFGTCASGPCVFMARNVRGTATQPAAVGQLWRCDPSAGPGACAPGDWALALGNAAGDPALTQAGSETNGAITVLAATRGWLYVGFDNATTGVQVFRSAVVPRSLSDLKGRGGCAAGSVGCEGLGGNGLGRARNTRVLDARVIDSGAGPELWLVVGDGAGAASVYRVAD
jgi:hypothetical protein